MARQHFWWSARTRAAATIHLMAGNSREVQIIGPDLDAIDSYEATRALDEGQLHALLEHGRPEQRVWAIWTLAITTSDVALFDPAREPEPGVRRNLAVVLAGHGELDLLIALASRDPSPDVRAAAIQLVTRFAIDDKLPAAFVIDRILVDGSEVKMAVLGTVFERAPPWLLEIAQQLVEDRDSDVRYEAFEALVRGGADAHALMWLEEIPEAECRLALMRWTARGRVLPCANALATSSRRLRRLLIESVRVASWDELAPAVGDEPALIRSLARRTPTIFDQMPLATLMRATLREPTDAWITMVRDRLASLATPGGELDELLHDFREVCVQRIADIDAHAGELKGPSRDPALQRERELLDDQRVALESALEAAARMLVH
jgi:hypothetical protein